MRKQEYQYVKLTIPELNLLKNKITKQNKNKQNCVFKKVFHERCIILKFSSDNLSSFKFSSIIYFLSLHIFYKHPK